MEGWALKRHVPGGSEWPGIIREASWVRSSCKPSLTQVKVGPMTQLPCLPGLPVSHLAMILRVPHPFELFWSIQLREHLRPSLGGVDFGFFQFSSIAVVSVL